MVPEITFEVKENVKQVSGERWLIDRAEQEEDVGEGCWAHLRTRNQAVWLEPARVMGH